jgi:hypothetical protein
MYASCTKEIGGPQLRTGLREEHILRCLKIMLRIIFGTNKEEYRKGGEKYTMKSFITVDLLFAIVKLTCYTPWRRLGGEGRYSSYSFLTSALEGG